MVTKVERDRDLAAVGLLDEPVRRALYEWVVKRLEPSGRQAAADAVGVTRALATFHLEKLVAGGLLEAGYLELTFTNAGQEPHHLQIAGLNDGVTPEQLQAAL